MIRDKSRLLALLAGLLVIGCGCGSISGTRSLSLEECQKKDSRESEQLDREVGPLLTKKARSTLYESSACDSVPEGGATVAYDLDSKAELEKTLKNFYDSGWSDLPKTAQPCLQRATCVASVGKKVDGRDIEVTAQGSKVSGYMLEVLFAN